MADVSKVRGPSGAPEGPEKKEKTPLDNDKFKEEMRKKVKEVEKIDPEEHKKRKQEAEEDEEQTPPAAASSTPPGLVPHFSTEQQGKKSSLSDLQKQGPGISPLESAQKTPHAPHKASFLRASPVESVSQEAEEPPSQAAPASPQKPAQEKWTPEGQRPVTAGPPESEQKHTSPAPTSSPEEKKKETRKPAPGVQTPPDRKFTADELDQSQAPKKEESSALFEQLGKKEGITPEMAAEEGVAAPFQPLPPPQIPEKGEEKKIEEEEKLPPVEGVMLAGGPGGEPMGSPLISSGPESLPPYANLPPQVQELFDRMVGVMTVMNLSGVTETVVTLNTPQFASSVFFGTQIIIQEFSTAPQAFNIQLSGSPQAIALFQNHADDLMAAFQAGKYAFRINRLETGYLTDRPLFKRKEKISGDKQDQRGDNAP